MGRHCCWGCLPVWGWCHRRAGAGGSGRPAVRRPGVHVVRRRRSLVLLRLHGGASLRCGRRRGGWPRRGLGRQHRSAAHLKQRRGAGGCGCRRARPLQQAAQRARGGAHGCPEEARLLQRCGWCGSGRPRRWLPRRPAAIAEGADARRHRPLAGGGATVRRCAKVPRGWRICGAHWGGIGGCVRAAGESGSGGLQGRGESAAGRRKSAAGGAPGRQALARRRCRSLRSLAA